ncbi:Wwox [Symbiodinium natans]|uniref:Wwox protein n=1 Tax=Symbiodinium natans TaxID=878477 RepID=A0A812SBV0_9DINO|nr:Wwox [Symbiodinium natans]
MSWKAWSAGAVLLVALILRADLLWNRGRSIPLLNFWRPPGFALADMPDLQGKVAFVTGASSGLGFETAKQLALANASVLVGCRDEGRCRRAFEGFRAVEVLHLDLADLRQVEQVAARLAQLPALHILVNNAGVATQFPHSLTRDGIETTFQVNFLSHFLLTTRLLPLLERSSPSRLVHLTSGAHRGAPADGVPLSLEGINDKDAMGPYARYGMAKLANLLFSQEIDRRFGQLGLYSNAVHPGVVATEMLRRDNFEAMLGPLLGAWAFRAAQLRNRLFAYGAGEAALNLLFCAASPIVELQALRGKLIVPIATAYPPRHAQAFNDEFARRLWEFSDELISTALAKTKSS